MAGVEATVIGISEKTPHHAMGDIAAVIEIKSTPEGSLVISFAKPTAEALAGRILGDAMRVGDDNLMRDCVGEIANVIAGQAKALLSGSPYQLAFRLPQIVVTAQEFRIRPGLGALVIVFSCELGEFVLQLFLNRT
jgi:chemotaxis protein CheX